MMAYIGTEGYKEPPLRFDCGLDHYSFTKEQVLFPFTF